MKKINKKMIIFITLLAITPKLFSRMGVKVVNKTGGTIRASVDSGPQDWKDDSKPEDWSAVKSGEQKFLRAFLYGKRAVYWKDDVNRYMTPRYSNPDYIEIYPDGRFIMTEKTIFGKTVHKKATAKRLIKSRYTSYWR